MPLDPIRIIRWFSGANIPSDVPISDTDPDPGLMGPGSVTWRLHHEQWMILGGAQAFLMQAAHPVVAQGAIDHSAYAEDPFGRVYRTVMAMSVVLTGSMREVNAMARNINHIHQIVKGTLTEDAGHYRAGEAYSAMDPGPLLWVHISFVESMLTAYLNFIGPLSPEDCEGYWQESLRYARRLGLTDAVLPPTYVAMKQYIRDVLASGEVAVGENSRTIARTILYPPLPWPRRITWGAVRLLAAGQLPAEIRQGYGLRWSWAHRAGFRTICLTCRLLRRIFPGALGRSVLVSYAERRARGELAQSSEQIASQSHVTA